MARFIALGRNWKSNLAGFVRSAKTTLLISSPYVTSEGSEFILANLVPSTRAAVRLCIMTDLSPLNVCQGSTDPRALRRLSQMVSNVQVAHLPRLHAKVYAADIRCAIVTSANLTAGGLALNYECGIEITDQATVEAVRRDMATYLELGANVSKEQLTAYCHIADRVRAVYYKRQTETSRSAQQEFNQALRTAEDELVKLKLAGGPAHAVFSRTILYVLKQCGPLSTERLHPIIEAIHPDLCDNNVDRVIDGTRFGKKWKHAVRTAQQHLKKRGMIGLSGGRWKVLRVQDAIGDMQ